MSSGQPESTSSRWWLPAAALVVAVVTPLLLTAPGRVVADGRNELLLHPGRALADAISVWDPGHGLGTVADGRLGRLWPLGVYHWAADAVGVPDWAAQRLWLAVLLAAAGGGILFLGRTWRWRPSAAVAATAVYVLSPVVATAVLEPTRLLPYAGLPWLLALVVRSLRHRGWRHPALFALTVATVGSTDATALVLVGLVPLAWISYSVWLAQDVSRARAVNSATKIGLLTLATNVWWIVGLTVQATNGIDAPSYTEPAEVVNRTTSAPEVLRGLGAWTAYLPDAPDAAMAYTGDAWLVGLSFAVPALAVLALGIVRWRHRTFVIALVVLGTVLAVGAYPFESPPPVGSVIRAALDTGPGLALRSLQQAVPIVILGIALGVGALVGAAAEQSAVRGLAGAAGATALAAAALPSLWTAGLVPEDRTRPEHLPAPVHDAVDHLDEASHRTRVLELPGTDRTTYSWGTTGDPVTAALLERPHVTRREVPAGSAASADLLRAIDDRIQDGTLDPVAVAPLARLLGAGDLLVRSGPDDVPVLSLAGGADGLGPVRSFGPDLAVVPVADPIPIITTHGDDRVILLSGSGAGVVDAASVGVLTGDELIRYSADLTGDPDFVRTHLVDDRLLVVTDTNRARAQRWDRLTGGDGFTETADGGLLDDDAADARLPVQDERPGTRTVVEQRGLTVRATSYGPDDRYLPAHRPAAATDGDVTTAWRVPAATAPGERIEVTAESPVRTDEVVLRQPAGDDLITRVELRFDGEDATSVALDDSSLAEPGQRVDVGDRTFSTLSVQITAVAEGSAPGGSVGLSDIDIAAGRVVEVVRMPDDLLEASGFRSTRYPLALLQTRMRTGPFDGGTPDEEEALRRVVELPATRAYHLAGSARLSPDAPGEVIDTLLGRPGREEGQPVATASGASSGLGHVASAAFDGDGSTSWISPPDPTSAWLRITAPAPVTFDRVDVQFVADEQHSVPAELEMVVDGAPVGTFRVAADPGPGGAGVATLGLPRRVTGEAVELRVTEVRARVGGTDAYGAPVTAPVAISEVDVAGLVVPPAGTEIDTGCRDDLLLISGQPVPVRVRGAVADAVTGAALPIELCDGPVSVDGGNQLFEATPGSITGLDLDQLVWGSTPVAASGPAAPADGPEPPGVAVLGQEDSSVDLAFEGTEAGEPFWLVFGQSHDEGWEVLETDAEVDGPQLVNGYANGFLVTPTDDRVALTLRFVPQNRVDVGLLVSAAAVIAVLVLALTPARELRPAPIPRQEPVRRLRALTYEGALPSRRDAVVVAVVGGVAGLLVANPIAAVLLAVVGGLSTRREGWRPLLTVLPGALLVGVAVHVVSVQVTREPGPGLGWPAATGRFHVVAVTAVLLLALDTVIEHTWRRGSHLD